MDELDPIFEEMVKCRKENLYVIYTATMTPQHGGHLSFKLLQLEKEFGEPHVLP